jgi:hypothetical protein
VLQCTGEEDVIRDCTILRTCTGPWIDHFHVEDIPCPLVEASDLPTFKDLDYPKWWTTAFAVGEKLVPGLVSEVIGTNCLHLYVGFTRFFVS